MCISHVCPPHAARTWILGAARHPLIAAQAASPSACGPPLDHHHPHMRAMRSASHHRTTAACVRSPQPSAAICGHLRPVPPNRLPDTGIVQPHTSARQPSSHRLQTDTHAPRHTHAAMQAYIPPSTAQRSARTEVGGRIRPRLSAERQGISDARPRTRLRCITELHHPVEDGAC